MTRFSPLRSGLWAALVSIFAAQIVAAIFTQPGNAQTERPAAGNKAEATAKRRAAIGNLVGHGGPVKAIAVSEDGTRALTGSFDYSAILWDITSEPPKIIHRLTDHNAAVNAVAFVPGSNRALTAGDDSLVRLWDLTTGKLLHKFEGHEPGSKIVGLSVTFKAESPQVQPTFWAVTSGWDRTARLWNLSTLATGPVLREHTAPVNAAVFSGDSKAIYTASSDGRIRAFDAATGDMTREVYKAGQGVNALLRLASSNYDRQTIIGSPLDVRGDHLLFGALSGQSGIIDGHSGQIIRQLPEAQRPILALADGTQERRATQYLPGLIAIGSGDGRIRVFRDGDGELVQEYKTPFGPVWALALVPQSADKPQRLYYAGLDDFVTLWQVAPRKSFEEVDASQYPRRFQQTGKSDDPVAKGEIQFARKCSICHTLTPDSANRAGPTLHNIFGRKIATLPGYPFSPELKTLDIVWNADTIAKLFELGPDKFTPGSKMPLQVMSDKAERDALIAFLEATTK